MINKENINEIFDNLIRKYNIKVVESETHLYKSKDGKLEKLDIEKHLCNILKEESVNNAQRV